MEEKETIDNYCSIKLREMSGYYQKTVELLESHSCEDENCKVSELLNDFKSIYKDLQNLPNGLAKALLINFCCNIMVGDAVSAHITMREIMVIGWDGVGRILENLLSGKQ